MSRVDEINAELATTRNNLSHVAEMAEEAEAKAQEIAEGVADQATEASMTGGDPPRRDRLLEAEKALASLQSTKQTLLRGREHLEAELDQLVDTAAQQAAQEKTQ